MIRRAKTVSKRYSLFYSLGALKFANLEDLIFEISEILLSFAISTKNLELAFLFSSISKSSRDLLWRAVNVAENQRLSTTDFTWSNRIEPICLNFQRCYVCFACANQQKPVALLNSGKRVLILTCARHSATIKNAKYLFLDSLVVTETSVFPDDDVLQRAYDNLKTLECRMHRTSTQEWREVRKGKLVVIRLSELDVAIRIGGLPQIDYKLTVGRKSLAAVEKMSSEQTVLHILCKGKSVGVSTKIIDNLKKPALPPSTSLQDRRRHRVVFPWRICEKKCSHDFLTTNPNAKLKFCSLCTPTQL